MIKFDARKTDLGGGMLVHRILPYRSKRMVGPFCFLDHMGPITIEANQNTDVRPHPHIGLSTLTYLFEGKTVHRDSLGTEVTIQPGEVNWMTAGRGISHSERSTEEQKTQAHRLHGLQFWVALPDDKEDIDPNFQHYEKENIPFIENSSSKLTLVAGEGFNMKSPVAVYSDLILLVIEAKNDFTFLFEKNNFELALIAIKGSATIQNEIINENQTVCFDQNESAKAEIKKDSIFILIGGEPFKTPRHIWWNLVSSQIEKIEAAKSLWKSGNFPKVPGETEFIPLPEH